MAESETARPPEKPETEWDDDEETPGLGELLLGCLWVLLLWVLLPPRKR